MDRERLVELLTAFLDDDLSAAERTELEKELETSEEARSLLDSYRRQADSLRALPTPMLTPDRKAAVLQDIKNAPTPTPIRPSATNNFVWLVGTIAACFVFFSASMALRPVSPEGRRLYLSAQELQIQPLAQTHQLVLKPGTDEVRVLSSQDLDGFLTAGAAVASLECDGGEVEGQRLKLRLSLDLDGDDEFDVVQESETFEIDGTIGYEAVTARFPSLPEQYHEQPLKGQARLELIGDSMSGDGLSLQFRSEQSFLSLPLRSAEV